MQAVTGTGFAWHELMTTEVAAAGRCYSEVTGLTVSDGPYPMLLSGGVPAGGLVGPCPEGPTWPSGGPEPHWVAYFATDDVDAAAGTAQRLGGSMLVAPMDVGNSATS